MNNLTRANHETVNRVVMKEYDQVFWAMLYDPINNVDTLNFVRVAHKYDVILRDFIKP